MEDYATLPYNVTLVRIVDNGLLGPRSRWCAIVAYSSTDNSFPAKRLFSLVNMPNLFFSGIRYSVQEYFFSHDVATFRRRWKRLVTAPKKVYFLSEFEWYALNVVSFSVQLNFGVFVFFHCTFTWKCTILLGFVAPLYCARLPHEKYYCSLITIEDK